MQNDFKLNISYPTPFWGIYVSGVYQNYQGAEAQTNWLISRTTRYAATASAPARLARW